MAIRISKMIDRQQTILKVDGRLKSTDIAELARAYRAEQAVAALDLTELHWADPEGVVLLETMQRVGVQLRGVSPYMELLLKPRA